MRTVKGAILLPPNTPKINAAQVLIEVRDVSFADAASVVVAQQRLGHVALSPNGQIPFELQVPEVEANRSLSFRVHIDMDGTGQVKSGDLLSTISVPVPSRGAPPQIQVPVSVI